MLRDNPWRTVGAIEFVTAAASQRAASYREKAMQLSALADAEPSGKRRGQLLEIAMQYQELAENLGISREE